MAETPAVTLVFVIAVCDISALARWGEAGLAQRLGEPCKPPRHWSLGSLSELDDDVLRSARIEATVARPLHIVVGSPSARIRSKRVVCHVWTGPLPEGAFYKLTRDVLIASPAFILLLMSSAKKGVPALACAAMELCGWYARSPRAEGGMYSRAPVCRLDDLRAFFERCVCYGASHVRESLKWAVEGSRSPMETALTLLFVLPRRLGGCRLPRPSLNYRLEIPAELSSALGRPYLVADLCWPEHRLILEYDSYAFHSSRRQVDVDSLRNEGLRDLGWTVRSVTAGMLLHEEPLFNLASHVCEQLGKGFSRPDARGMLDLARELVLDA